MPFQKMTYTTPLESRDFVGEPNAKSQLLKSLWIVQFMVAPFPQLVRFCVRNVECHPVNSRLFKIIIVEEKLEA